MRCPSRLWLAVIPILLIVGIGGSARWLAHAIRQTPTGATVWMVTPGTRLIQVDRAGLYRLWHVPRATVGEQRFDYARERPTTLTVTVVRVETGDDIAAQPTWGIPRSSPFGLGYPLKKIYLPAPGSYKMSVTGPGPERFVIFGPSLFERLFQAVMAAAALNVLALGISAWLLVTVIACRIKATRVRVCGQPDTLSSGGDHAP